MTMSLSIFDVAIVANGFPEPRGSILMVWGSDDRRLEHALAALGIYAPRGLDSVRWGVDDSFRYAVIRDCSANPLVVLTERRRLRVVS